MKTLKIATIPGDGVGKEIMPEAVRVLEKVAEVHGGLKFEFTEFPYSCDYYLEHGVMMPDDGLDRLSQFDSIFLGAVGDASKVPDHISLWGLLLKIRKEFQQEINIRPAKLFKGIEPKLSNRNPFDMVIVRENSEGEYSSIGGRIFHDDNEIAIQNNVFSKRATKQAMNIAFDLASKRKGLVTSATKSNGIFHAMPFWDEIFKEVSGQYPDIKTESKHIDALAAYFVTHPQDLDVVVASNLFGDILSDLGAAIMGSIGIAPSANLNLNGKYPSMFEPVHGSAPDIAGQGIANPIGQIWTAKMLLEFNGEEEIAEHLLKVIEDVTADGYQTGDLGGKYKMTEVTDEIIKRLGK
ncbi:tartrate dehydrogenase [Jeotgalicoccus meleagridis]|uniref:D-malate dehydrogenase (decarboxylating) n=1 Tax=Jeotgalicoccus meleagridis TaxID=2759181 RepID=A0A6V7RFS0_9STAP|nr:tartrate dehydrogenase [Jeotgalicoccus meleagridis]CAD2075798.1 Tartrate dehydrogenase/decarboxylase [Jeotgalicoccus meleagridis]